MNDTTAQAVLRRFSYGVYAITVKHEAEEHASTVSWVTQASFHPPMVAVVVENTSRTIGLIRDAHHFALSIFHEGQREVAEKLGRPSVGSAQKLKGIKTRPAPASGVPVLAEALAWVECRVVATLPGGDHTIVLGEVVEAGVEHDGAKPLTLDAARLTYTG